MTLFNPYVQNKVDLKFFKHAYLRKCMEVINKAGTNFEWFELYLLQID